MTLTLTLTVTPRSAAFVTRDFLDVGFGTGNPSVGDGVFVTGDSVVVTGDSAGDVGVVTGDFACAGGVVTGDFGVDRGEGELERLDRAQDVHGACDGRPHVEAQADRAAELGAWLGLGLG